MSENSMEMSRTTHNQVRNVLMNEMGLTREFIRDEVQRIIETEVQKMIAGERIEQMLEWIIAKRVNEYWRDRAVIQRKIEEIAYKQINEEIKNTISGRINISIFEPKENL